MSNGAGNEKRVGIGAAARVRAPLGIRKTPSATATPVRRAAAVLAVAAVLSSTPAMATDDAERIALLGALGLDAASGKSSLGASGGEIEAWLLSSAAIRVAAETITKRLAANSTYILLDRDDVVDLSAPRVISQRIALLKGKVESVRTSCHGTAQAVGPSLTAMAIQPTLADLTGALKTDTTVSGVPVAAEDRALMTEVAAAAVAAKRGISIVVASDIVAPAGSRLIADWAALEEAAEELRASPCAKTPPAQAVLARYDKLQTQIDTAKDGANTRLEAAAGLAYLTEQSPKLLRVTIEKAGGTATVRSNIWYTVGFPGALQISGGLLAGYRAIDPATGIVESSDLLSCGTPSVRLQKVSAALPTMKAVCFPQ